MKKLYPYLLHGINWILAGLLSLLGFSCASDNIDGPVEMYGTPYGTFEFKGKVVDRLNNPIPNIQVEISDSIPSRGWMKSDTLYSDEKGEINWKMNDFPCLTYRLIATDPDGNREEGPFAADTSFLSLANAVYEGGSGWYKGNATVEKEIVLDKYVDMHTEPYALYTIYGRVTDEEGYPLPGIVISTTPGYLPEKPESDFDYPAITNERGMYSFTYDQAQPVEHVIHTSYLEKWWNSKPYILETDSVDFAEIELKDGKGMLIGKGSKEVNFVLKRNKNNIIYE